MKRIVALGFVVAVLALPHSANALTIGANELLGIVVPGTPADEENESGYDQRPARRLAARGRPRTFLAITTGRLSGTVMGNNPSDPNNEVYTLKFSATTVIPAPPAPLATRSNRT